MLYLDLTLRDLLCGCAQPYVIGRRGTAGVLTVRLDYSDWVRAYGSGVITLMVKPYGAGAAYPVMLDDDHGLAAWLVSISDTQTTGVGQAEFIFHPDASSVDKSAVFAFSVLPDIGRPLSEIPDAYADWVSRLEQLGAETLANAQDATASAEAAEAAQTAAENAEQAAAESEENAEAWAVGERDGQPVPSTDPTYHNNAKYYAAQAASNAPVQSVNGKTGAVELDAEDVGALPDSSTLDDIPDGATYKRTTAAQLQQISTNAAAIALKQARINASGILKGSGNGQVSAAVAGTDYQTPLTAGTDYATPAQVDAKYTKPAGGIPASDMAQAVQTSLGKADTALQEHQSLAAYRTAEAQDVIDGGKQATLVSGVNIKTINDQSILGGGNINIQGGGGGQTVDDALSLTSENPVQNKAIYAGILKAFPTDTASGSVASFGDGADGLPLKKLVVNIEPEQSGSGDPSPENVRPISGWTGCNLYYAGKNLLDESLIEIGGYNASANPSQNGNLAYRRLSINLPAGTYVFNCDLPNFYRIYSFIDNVSFSPGNRTVPIYFTLEKPSNFKISFRNTSTSNITAPFQTSIAVGSIVTKYEPYSGLNTYNIIFPNPPYTVYGGTLTINDDGTGELKARPYYASYDGETLVGPWLSSKDVYAEGTTPTTGAQVVDMGGAETVYNITAEQVKTLLGTNNIWADTGNVSVEYRADTKLYISKRLTAVVQMLGNIETGMTASKAYAVNDFLTVNNQLYIVTAPIASGGTITPGTNVTATTVGAQLTGLVNS